MPDLPPSIFLSDWVKTLRLLQPKDTATRDAIARLLGLQIQSSTQTPAPIPALGPERTAGAYDPSQRSLTREVQEPGFPATPEAYPGLDVPEPGHPVPSQLERTAQKNFPLSLKGSPLPPAEAEDQLPAPPLTPLLAPEWVRGILFAALATYSPEGEIELERIIDHLASRQYTPELPRRLLPTLKQGVQVLVDRYEGMLPYRKDQSWLVKRIRNVVGRDRTEVLYFSGCPSRRAGTGPEITWTAYEPPVAGTPVLLLSDLGLGGPLVASARAGLHEWLGFANLLDEVGCPLLAFTPYSLSRVPGELRRVIAVIPWDRKTSAARVKSLSRFQRT